jgi:DNA-directed RNA polymerase
MNSNEQIMKAKGESKVWKSVTANPGSKKKIASTQIGQQLLFDEALRIFEDVKDWIHNKTARRYRRAFTEYFTNDDLLLQKIIETMLVISGDIEGITGDIEAKTLGRSRRKKVQTVKDRVLPELEFENAFRFLEVVVDYSDYFEIDQVLNKDKDSWRWSIKYKCTLSKIIVAKLSLEAAVAFYPLAMLEPPIPWTWDPETKELIGGYAHFQYPLVRSNHFDINYNKYSQGIFDRANYIQQTPWIVNEEVLAQLIEDTKLPKKADFLKMEYPDTTNCKWDINLKEPHELTDKEVLELQTNREYAKTQIELYDAERGDYESAVGKYRAIKLAIQIAEKYVGETLYFPHNYDFRGRIYPISIGLSPQGSDEVKALLLYKNTEELTESGIQWNWAYLASLYGDDKLPFAERVKRGKQLLHADYKSADEPYQFLSHQIELKAWFYDNNYAPNTRIHLDACNSGSQFTSAITGDKDGCEATNVLPTYDDEGNITRQDAYMLVAEKSVERTNQLLIESDDEEKTEILNFLKDLLKNHGRKLCKTPTMVSNYGGTAAGRADILWAMFRSLNCDKKWITKKNAHLFAMIIGDSIQGVLNGGKAFELYVQKMSNCIARGNNPVTWETADGFHVIHKKNKELKSKQVLCHLPGSRRNTKITKKIYSKELSGPKMRSAISPNYIHSLDAELLRETSRRMEEAGIENSDWIHDSFGCHPNHVDKMLLFSKEEFINLVKRNPLKALDSNLRTQVSEDPRHQKALSKIIMPRFEDCEIEIEIENLINSDWFFS